MGTEDGAGTTQRPGVRAQGGTTAFCENMAWAKATDGLEMPAWEAAGSQGLCRGASQASFSFRASS